MCHGQELSPALAPTAEIYRTQVSKLEERRVDVLIAAQDIYLKALDEADAKATKDGDVKLLEIISKEKDSLKNGVILPVPPEDFPRKLQPARKACVRAFENADDAFAKEVRKLNGSYLSALAKIQTAKPDDSQLTEQIEREKKRVISGISGPIIDLETDLVGTRWQHLYNPTETRYFGEDMVMNQTWKYTIPSSTEVTIHWNENSKFTMKLGKDGRTLLNGDKPEFVLISGAKKR